MSLNRLKALGGIFRHLPLSPEYSVSPMHVCVLYKHCGLGGTPLERSVEGGYRLASFFLLSKPVLGNVFSHKPTRETCK